MKKKHLRQKARQILTSFSQDSVESKSRLVSNNLASLIKELYHDQIISNGCIGAYAPIQQEVIWFSSFNQENLNYSLPHIFGETEMKYFNVDLESIMKNNIGLELDRKYQTEIVTPDALFIPGLAFTLKGERLGRGRGYFDRFLNDYTGVKIGVAFEDQIFKELVTDEHDQLVEYLVTEKQIYKI